MACRFTVNNRPSLDVGHFTGFTSTGLYILKFADNQVEVFTEAEITEIKPFAFSVRFQDGSTETYTFQDPMKRVDLNDVLITDIGDVCVVTKIDVNYTHQNDFVGRRLTTRDI